MKPLAAALSCLLASPLFAQVVGEAANVGTAGSSAGASVAAVPMALSAPSLSPASTPGLAAALTAPARAPSLITPIDPATLPNKGKDYTPDAWAKLTAGTKDEGSKAVLRSMTGDNPADPRLTVTLKNGETIDESGGSRFRAYRDFHDLRTPGYDEGEMLPGSELVYSQPK